MAVPTLLELAESGAHFGHHRSMVYPKAQGYIYTIKSNVALIDLEQTQNAITKAQQVISQARDNGQTILFVGTKRSVRTAVKEVATAIEAPYITERWFGGTLTNFATMTGNIKKMNELTSFLKSDEAAKLSKKDRLGKENQLHRLERFLGGLTKLTKLPDLIVLATASNDNIAIEEANQLSIPVLAITDTDINPARITYPIPANDDAPRAVELILRSIVQAPTEKSSNPKSEVPNKEEKAEAVAEEKPKKATKAKAGPKAKAEKKPAAKKTVKAKK